MSDPDPRNLIAEAYNIDGIGLTECRSIFFDWALSRPAGDEAAAIGALLARYAATAPDHPMTVVLREGLSGAAWPTGRRGGRRGRQGA
jgi:hypothetical protein